MGSVEIKRAILRAGGLWSANQLVKICDAPRAKQWQYEQDFPELAWRSTKVKLYCGYEIYHWLESTGRYVEGQAFYDAIVRLIARS
jgi:hypothetical protein